MQEGDVIAVAVSGGADSLYALLRLQASGRSLIALHGIFVPPDFAQGEKGGSTRAERATAVREGLAKLCEARGIALHIVDFSDEFLRRVIRPFVRDYADGLTPNPCVLCNARIKFGLLLDKARELGASRLATGHYARLVCDEGGLPALLQGEDPHKDQSYFLAMVPGERLAAACFPLGGEHKRQVLERLREQDVHPPQPGESQDVCFVPDDEYREFMPRAAKALGIALPGPGPMLLANGQRLGVHQGLWRYTEGQRRGLGLGWKEPLHVVAKENDGNVLRLGPKEETRAAGCLCDSLNVLLPAGQWNRGEQGKGGEQAPVAALVKTRYRERPKRAEVRFETSAAGTRMRVCFAQPDTAVAPGQTAAVYLPSEGRRDGEDAPLRLVAGGRIREVF